MYIKKIAPILIFLIFFINSLHVSFAYEDISNWTTSSPLPYQIASHASFSVFNKIYVIGGSHTSGESHSEILVTESNVNGNITGWNTINELGTKLIWHSTTNNQNFAYILGGFIDNINNVTGKVSDVFFTKIDSNGVIGSWINTISLPEPLALGNALIYKDKIYYAGGSIFSDKIYSANINPIDGTLDSWVTLSTKLPADGARIGFGMIENNGFLYIIGGQNSSEIKLDSVYRAQFFADGTISNWVIMPNLPQKVTRASLAKIDNVLISAGGISTSDIIDDVFFAKLNSDGSINGWYTSTNKLFRKNCCSPLVSSNNHLFLIGGHDGTVPGYYSDVFTAKLISDDPQYISLDVPDLKQYNGGWENDLYGHTNETIGDFGCALTSASMVLKFFGHNINPRELNIWLKEQKDGYIRNNLVNWLAVSRYTKINESTTSPVLEYSRSEPVIDKVLSNLQENLPTIVKVPGHFVVTKSQTETSYGINDPGYNNRDELLPEYQETDIKSLSTYTPSQTDLSYMMFIGSDNLKFELFDSFGNIVDPTYIQAFTENPITQLNGSVNSGGPLTILLFPKPTSGKYTLKVSSIIEGNFSFDSYLYDLDGNVIQKTLSIYFTPTDTYSFNIDFTENKGISLKNGGLYKSIIKKVDTINKDKRLVINLARQIENLTPKLLGEGFSSSILSILKPYIF